VAGENPLAAVIPALGGADIVAGESWLGTSTNTEDAE